jgi:hypothetical protein
MRKGWIAFLVGAFVVTMMHAGVARALSCIQLVTPETVGSVDQTGDGCNLEVDANPASLHTAGGYNQLTGGGCSSDPALPLLSSQIYDEGNGQITWRCIFQLPSVDGVCQANGLTLTATSICCK